MCRTELSAGVAGDFYFLKLIEPQAARYLPSLAPALAEQQVFLLQGLDPKQRQSAQAGADRWNSAGQQSRQEDGGEPTPLSSLLRRAEELTDPAQKDRLYYTAATVAVQSNDYDLASSVVEKLSDKSRDAARQLISFSIAREEIKDGQLERAEERARRDDDPVRRAYLLNLIADSLLSGRSKDAARAADLLRQVEQTAAKIDSNREKISALVGAAASYSRFDPPRASELLREVVRAANKTEGFTGDTAVERSIQVGDFGFYYRLYDDSLTFTQLVGRLGRAAFNPTLADVTSLKFRVVRLEALLALCGAVLDGR